MTYTMKYLRQHLGLYTDLLNGICPRDSEHGDISTEMDDHSGRFELKCHNCDQTFIIHSINE